MSNRIKELRQAHGTKQAELARAVKVSQATMSEYESGKYEPDIETLRAIAKYYGVTVDYVVGGERYTRPSAVRIPVYRAVAAGIPIEAIEDIVDWEEITPDLAASGKFFALRIQGQSMEPKICDGDVVVVRQQEDADTGDTAIVLVNGNNATCKRIKKDKTGLWLIPNNPAAFDAVHYSEAEIATLPVKIIGKVVELRRKM